MKKGKGKKYKRMLREVQTRLILMHELANRGIMDYNQMRSGLDKVIATISQLFRGEDEEGEQGPFSGS